MLTGTRRDEIASILERVSKEGLDHPRNLDSALDAIGQALNGEPMMKCTDGNEVYFLQGEDTNDAIEAFGSEIKIEHGFFVGSCDD